MLRSKLSLCLAALSLMACSSPGAGSEDVRVNATESVAPRIVGGVASTTSQDSVVYLSLGNGNYCTGTLVAPNLVLTARHCVSQTNNNDNGSCGTFSQDNNPGNFQIAIGVSANGNSQKVAKGIAIFHEASSDICGADIALLQLNEDVTGAVISPLRFGAVKAGDTGFTAVGYGKIDNNGDKANSRLSRGALSIDDVGAVTYDYITQKNQSMEVQVSAGEFTTGEATCDGDDGGPLLDSSGNIVGVMSRGIDDNCQDRPTIWSDVVSHQAMIMAAAQTAGHPLTFTTTSGTDAGSGSSDQDAGAGIGPTPRSSGAQSSSTDSTDDGTDDDTSGGDLIDPSQGTQPASSSGCSLASQHGSDSGSRLAFFGIALGAILMIRRRRAS